MQENKGRTVVVAQMRARKRQKWEPEKKKKTILSNQPRRNTIVFAAVSLCICGGVIAALHSPESTQTVMSHLTTEFEYDETLGRLQFVSNILPESAMVFLTTDDDARENMVVTPEDARITHAWAQEEPWLEYECVGDVVSCQDGEVMTIVKNRDAEYTVRVMHEGGYESVYSGLDRVDLAEMDTVKSGQLIGTTSGSAAFELRKDGLSIQPVFSSSAF